MYIVIESYKKTEYNPYYSPSNAYRENEYNIVQAERVFYFDNDEALAAWVKLNPKANYTAYRAEKVNIAISTVVRVTVS